MTAYIAYDNIIPFGTITADEIPGYGKENAYDWFTYTWWNSGISGTDYNYIIDFSVSSAANYMAISSHNLADTETLVSLLDGSDIDIITPFTPQNNNPILITFPLKNTARFRFNFSSIIGPSYIGVLSVGQILELPEGIKPAFTPPQWGHDDVIISSKSQSGVFLGRSIERYGLKHRISQSQVDPAWMRENWLDLAEALRIQPFFYSWDYENYPEDTVYAWLDDKMPVPMYTNPVYTDFSINCRCVHDPKQSPVPS